MLDSTTMLRVLVVCTGNICRSPMAHGFLADRSRRQLNGAIKVRSAGTWARKGSPPTREAIDAAAERGVDIHELRSSPVKGDVARQADLVLTMTGEQRAEVLEAAPEAAQKTFTLKEFVALLRELPPCGGLDRGALLERVEQAHRLRMQGAVAPLADQDVVDPLSMSYETYRAVAWEIDGLIDDLVHGLAGVAVKVSAPAED